MTSHELAPVIAYIQEKARAMTGIRDAPAEIPDSANVFPFVVTYPRVGRMELASAGWANYFHTIYTEIHVSQALLSSGIAQALPYAELFAKIFLNDPQLLQLASEAGELRYTFGRLEWGGVPTIGFRFEIDVKLHLDLSVAP